MPPIITLTTDFGLADPFVGLMKGAILSRAPKAQIVDLTHAVPAQDVLAAALALEQAVDHFPPATIHVAVVDPGVGTQRQAVALKTERSFLVGPDNGLFDLVLRKQRLLAAVRLMPDKFQRKPVSATFQGRDIFAPAAAQLAKARKLQALGEPTQLLAGLELSEPVRRGRALQTHVLHSDHFGNLITDLTQVEFERLKWDAQRVLIRVGRKKIQGIKRTYADVEVGQPVAYFGSGGRLELGIRGGNARERLRVGRGFALILNA